LYRGVPSNVDQTSRDQLGPSAENTYNHGFDNQPLRS